MIDCAASIELFGFVGSGMFSIFALMRLYVPSTVISCALPFASGSAQISTFVFSAPMPASERVAATFTFAGKPFAASVALPSKILVLIFICARFIPILSTWGAPLKPIGGLVEAILLLLMPSRFSAFTPSIPANAPDGTIMRPVDVLCISNISGNMSRAHPLIIMKVF